MWIVKLALDRPYTFIVLALLILLLSPVVILRTPVDMFPSINIPVMFLWAGFGVGMREMLQNRARIRVFNIVMGLLLAASVLALLRL